MLYEVITVPMMLVVLRKGTAAAHYVLGGPTANRQGQFRENVTTISGVVVASIGESKPAYGKYQELRHADFKRSRMRKLYLDGTRIVGALLVGEADDAGVIRHCIANKIDISPWKKRIAKAPMDFGKIRNNFV